MSEQAADALIGFASPATAPLSNLAPPGMDTPGAVPMPMFTAPEQVVPLELLVPQPPVAHDPNEPLVEIDPETPEASAWTPDQPLGDWLDPVVDPAQLPPPTGAPIIAASPTPAPAQIPGAPHQMPPPQQAPTQQWAPPGFPPANQPFPAGIPANQQGWTPNPPGAWVPPQPVPRQPNSPLSLVIAAEASLGIGLFFPWIGVIALIGVTVGALAMKASGRYVSLFSALIACYLSWQFFLGYLAPSIWVLSIRWLCGVVGVSFALMHLQVRLQKRPRP